MEKSNMSLFEELSSKFPTIIVEPFKEPCLVIDAKNFKPQWEDELKRLGCKIVMSDYLGKAVFLIRKTNIEASSQTATNVPTVGATESTEKASVQRRWTPEEEAFLADLIEKGGDLDLHSIAEKLGRTVISVRAKIQRLQRKIKPKSEAKIKTIGEAIKKQVNAQDSLGELISALNLLYPKYKLACKVLLQNAHAFMER